MKVNRKKLLEVLETAAVGLSQRAIVEQSDCFVFTGGKVVTFNDQVAISMDSTLDFEGAVQAKPLLELFRRLSEEELEVDYTDEGLKIKGKGRRAIIRAEQEILLPVEGIEKPGKWRPVPEQLVDALQVASACCSTDESFFVLTCVHLAADRVESGDDHQVIYYPIDTGIKQSTLLKRESIDRLSEAKPTEWSEGETWLHFRNSSGTVLSVRRYVDEFPDTKRFIDVKGSKVKFPDSISDSLDKAQIFSAEDTVNNQVTVKLDSGKLYIEGKGPSGWYREQRKIKYTGETLEFRIEPRLLLEISKRSEECVIGEGKIKVDAGRFVYISCTTPIEE